MDFLKKFFENIYLYLTTTITGYFAALWLTLRHPILGPQYLARAHSGDRAVIDPFLFMFITACLVITNTFAFDLSRNDVLGPLTAGKAGPKLYMIAVSALAFTVIVTAVCAFLRWLVRLRHATFKWPEDREASCRLLRRRRLAHVPSESSTTLARLSGVPYILPASISFMALMSLFFTRTTIGHMFLNPNTIGAAANWFPRTAFTFEYFGFSHTAIPFPVSYGLLLSLWLLSVVFTPAFIPMARVLLHPMQLIKKLHKGQWLGVVIGASILSTTVFLAVISGAITYLWLTGPKAKPELTLSEFICDFRDLPNLSAAFHYDSTFNSPIVFAYDTLAIIPMRTTDSVPNSEYQGRGIHGLSGAIPMKIQSVSTAKGTTFFEIAAESQGLITMTGYLELEEPWQLNVGDKLLCGLQASNYRAHSLELSLAAQTLEGKVLAR